MVKNTLKCRPQVPTQRLILSAPEAAGVHRDSRCCLVSVFYMALPEDNIHRRRYIVRAVFTMTCFNSRVDDARQADHVVCHTIGFTCWGNCK